MAWRRRGPGGDGVFVLWIRAGRPRVVPAGLHPDIGIPQFVNTTPVYELEQVFTERVRTEFINRGNYKVQPNSTGVDAVLTGEILYDSHSARQLHR